MFLKHGAFLALVVLSAAFARAEEPAPGDPNPPSTEDADNSAFVTAALEQARLTLVAGEVALAESQLKQLVGYSEVPVGSEEVALASHWLMLARLCRASRDEVAATLAATRGVEAAQRAQAAFAESPRDLAITLLLQADLLEDFVGSTADAFPLREQAKILAPDLFAPAAADDLEPAEEVPVSPEPPPQPEPTPEQPAPTEPPADPAV